MILEEQKPGRWDYLKELALKLPGRLKGVLTGHQEPKAKPAKRLDAVSSPPYTT